MELDLINSNNFKIDQDIFINCYNLIPHLINHNNVFYCFQLLNESNNNVKLNVSSNVDLCYNDELLLEPNVLYTFRLQLLDLNNNKLALFQDNPIKQTNINFL